MTDTEAMEAIHRLVEATHRLARALERGEAEVTDLDRFLRNRRGTIEALPERAIDPRLHGELHDKISALIAADRRLAKWCARRKAQLRAAARRRPSLPSSHRLISEKA